MTGFAGMDEAVLLESNEAALKWVWMGYAVTGFEWEIVWFEYYYLWEITILLNILSNILNVMIMLKFLCVFDVERELLK